MAAERLTTVFSEYSTADYALSLLLATDGYPLVRCTTGKTTDYTFRIPEEDLKCYLTECIREDTQVGFLKVISAKRLLDDVFRRAKNNCGIWTSSVGFFAQREAAS